MAYIPTHKAESTYTDTPSKDKKEVQAFLGIINSSCKFSPNTADPCESLINLMSAKTEWTWKATYEKMFHKAKQT